jgi:ribonucleoside-diphosphate reductase alpha chain
MGSTRIVTPINCYMSGDIADSAVRGEGNIMQRATEAFATMRLGGGIGTNFSTLRPNGANIKTLDSYSSGPVSFMHIFDAVGLTVSSSGHRRGAQMGVLRVDHPDVEEFVHAKNNSTSLTGFNMSLLVPDAFMKAVRDGGTFDLVFNGEVVKTINPAPLWNMIMRSTHDYAEPGVIFIDRINDNNNLWYAETITGTNPCGEIPLPPFGACLLGSFNLTKYVTEEGEFDFDLFAEDIPICVRALDNVIDRAPVWPLPEQEAEMKSKRRIGIGITGLANALEFMGMPYGSTEFCLFTKEVMTALRDSAYLASIEIAKEKGPFPLFGEDFMSGEYIQRLPVHISDKIRENGIRNSHLIAIAPTGTISLTADNVSSGLEPVFAHQFDRTVYMSGGQRTESVQDYGLRVFGVKGRTASELTPQEHLDVLATCAPLVDQSISKTINVPHDVDWEEFKGIYMQAWERKCKGVTTYRVGGEREGILNENESDPEDEAAACAMDETTGRWECE